MSPNVRASTRTSWPFRCTAGSGGGVGTIDHVINDTGAAVQGSSTIPVNVVGFP
jgi:hypothetical protein